MNPSRLLRPFFAVRTAAVLAAAALAGSSARAATQTANGYTWTYEIVGDGAVIGRDDYKAAIDPKPGQNASVTIPSTLGGKPVTVIGAYAFSQCEEMRDVGIPSTVTSIGNNAFYGCISLDLNSLSLPDSLLDIGNGAFGCCFSLRSVTIPDGVTNIGASAFSDCYLLQSVTIPDSVARIGFQAFCECGTDEHCLQSPFDTTTIPGVQLADGWAVGYTDALAGERDLAGVRGIADGAFRYCAGLTGVTIPGTVPVIPFQAFQECAGLVRATISDGVKDIGNEAFNGCGVLADAKIPGSVTNIGAYAFMGSALAYVWIPDSVEGLGGAAFDDCPNMTLATIGNGLKGDYVGNPFGGTTPATVYVSDIYQGPDIYYGLGRDLPVGLALSPSGARPFSPPTEIGAVCSIPGAVLRFTTDGTAPTASSPVFAPVVASSATTVRVGAFVDGELALTTRGDYRPFVSAGAKGTVAKHGDGYAVTANDDAMLFESDLSFALSKDAYLIAVSPDHKMASVRLRRPEFDVENPGFHDLADHDATGLLVKIDPADLDTRPEQPFSQFYRGLPVKTYPGFFYRALWGDAPGSLSKGVKALGTGEVLCLGVILQTGDTGFYGVEVSEE